VLKRSVPAVNSQSDRQSEDTGMLYWALIFLVVALVAGLFGFGGIASASAGIAQILFVIFLVLLVASLLMHFFRRPRA
jgi:uncharacterized membrane protein YtjA (UPF0391 family)